MEKWTERRQTMWYTGNTKLWHITEEGPVQHREISVTSVVLHEMKVTFGAMMPHDLLVDFPQESYWAITAGCGGEFCDDDVIMRFRKCMIKEGYIGEMTSSAPEGVQSIRIAVVLFCEEGMWIK